MCVCDLLYSEWGAYFLSSEDYGALSQDFRQLEGIQAQQLTGITGHWKMDKDVLHFCNISIQVLLFPHSHVNWPCLVVIWAPPAVMNSMFPSCKTPDSSLNMSLISSSVNSNTFSASYADKSTVREIRCYQEKRCFYAQCIQRFDKWCCEFQLYKHFSEVELLCRQKSF